MLNLLRRHHAACAAKRPIDSYTSEVEERRHGFKRCECRIYAHGTLNGVSKKFATKVRDWNLAREIIAPFLAAGSWDVTGAPTPPPSPKREQGPTNSAASDFAPGTKPRMPIPEAVKSCLKDVEDAGSAKATIKNYREILAQLQRFSDELGLRFLDEWKPAIVRQFRNSWEVMQSTRRKKMSILKPFFELFVEDEVIDSNPARIRTRRNRAVRKGEDEQSQPRNPYTDVEIERMREACANYGVATRRWPRTGETDTGHKGRLLDIGAYREYHRKWTGEDLRDFIDVSRHTGLRIVDVATFHVDRLKPNGEVKVRPQKNGNWVCVWVPEWVQETIRRRAAIHGSLIFGKHATSDLNTITDQWRRKLNKLWESCGPWEQKPVHHRFRHTFVRVLLEHGMSPKDVADLVGDTERTIERHYSQWMPERQKHLTSRLREAFGEKPRLHKI